MTTLTLTAIFLAATNTFDLPPDLVNSVCYVESQYDINAVHHDDGVTDSLGVCQVKLETAKWMGFKGTAQDLMDPLNNVYYAAKYLRYNLTRYAGDKVKAVIAYNRGNAQGLTSTKYSNKVMAQFNKGETDGISGSQRFKQRYDNFTWGSQQKNWQTQPFEDRRLLPR